MADDGKVIAGAKAGGDSSQPKKRIRTADDARGLAGNLVEKMSTKTRRGGDWYRFQGQYGMRPPENPKHLERIGKGHLANFNTGEFRSGIRSDVQPYYSMIMTGATPAKWETLHGEVWERDYWMTAWSGRYKELLTRWKQYSTQCMLFLKERAMFGYGPVIWPHANSWQFSSRPARTLLLPAGTSCDQSEWWFCQIVDSMKVHELVSVLTAMNNRKAQGLSVKGWNKEQVEKAIKHFSENETVDVSMINDRPEIAPLDLSEELLYKSYSKFDDIVVVRNYIKEFDGQWSESIFTLNGKEGFLFEGEQRYYDACEFINSMPYDIEFKFSDIKGLGDLLTTPTMARDKLMNSAVNSAMINSSLIIQGAYEGDEAKWNQIMWDFDGTYLPAGLNVVQNQLRHNNELLLIAERFGQISDGNTRSTSSGELERGPQKTARQFVGEQSRRVQLSQYSIDFFNNHMTEIHSTIMSRIQKQITDLNLPLANVSPQDMRLMDRVHPGSTLLNKVLLKLVNEDQVPVEAVLGIDNETCKVKFPPTLEQLTLVMGDISSFDPEAQKSVRREYLSQAASPDFAAEIIPGSAEQLDNSQEQKAQIENASFRAGVYVSPGTRDNHLAHAFAHTGYAMQRMSLYEDQLVGPELKDKVEFAQEMRILWEHCMGDGSQGGMMGHVNIVRQSQDAAQQVEELLASWGQFSGMMQKLEAEIGEQQQAEQEANMQGEDQPDPVEQIRVQKEQAALEYQAQKHQVEMEMMQQRFETEQQIIRDKHNLEIEAKQIQLEAQRRVSQSESK